MPYKDRDSTTNIGSVSARRVGDNKLLWSLNHGPFKDMFESIDYGTDPLRSRPNHCAHTKWTRTISTSTVKTGSGFYDTRIEGGIYIPLSTPGHAGSASPPMPTYGEVVKRFSGTSNTPQLLNFLAELRSGKRLFQGAYSSAVRMAREGIHTPKLSGNRRLRKDARRYGFRRAASKHLAYKFGVVAPILDLVDAVKAAATAGDKLREVYDGQGKPVKMAWSSNQTFSETVEIRDGDGAAEQTTETKSKATRFIIATYTLPKIPRVFEDLNFFVSRLGLDNIVSAVWEGVPYSFVVDWFLPIGRTLESIEPDVFQVQNLTIVSHYVQVKTTSTVETKMTGAGSNDSFEILSPTTCKGTITTFSRTPSVLQLKALPEFEKPELNTGQVITGIELVAQRI